MVCRPGHENDPLERIRHSCAHVMADAVQSLWPATKVTIGPVIEDGFFYDFAPPPGTTFTEKDLEKIERKMKEIVEKDYEFKRLVMDRKEAEGFFHSKNENYKVEIIHEIPDGERITLYEHGSWRDLCKGPHVQRTGEIKAFKLLSVAGAYWRGDERRGQLQRIYGTAFPNQKELDEYLQRLKEAERRDHRRLGRELDLFSTLEEDGAGLVLWHPKGGRIRQVIEDYWREAHRRGGYEIVYTPHIAQRRLWQTSGHLDFYKDYLYSPMEMEGVLYQLKPMNCPFHVKIYQSRLRSYRDLPLRWAELGTVYRYERSGVLHGLLRVRGFTQDDAHLFCRPDQLEEEVVAVLDFTLRMLRDFGFSEQEVYLATAPEKKVGSKEDWDQATEALRRALERKKIPFQEDPGEGVFYGPKIDIKIKDMLKRAWQCSTIQVDFNLPKRFGLSYVTEGGDRRQPIMLHRALLGSLERFLAVLIEHYGGDFPLWLAPVQALVIPVAEGQAGYAREVHHRLGEAGLRSESDDRNEKLGARIRDAELQKIPYMLVVGKRESDEKRVSVRSRREGDLGSMDLDQLLSKLTEEVKRR